MESLRIAHCRIFRYRLALAMPLVIAGRAIHAREGLLIRIEDRFGSWGWGDVAPLPRFSRESVEDVEAALADVARRLRMADIDPRVNDQESWQGSAPSVVPPASVQFGVETALANLSRRYETGADTDLPCFDGVVPVNGLLAGAPEQVISQARKLRDAGCRALKLKVGNRTLAQDADLTRRVRLAAGEEMKLRLDANRSWSLGQAVEFCREIGDAFVEYLEEPLRDPTRLGEFCDTTGIPVALDESLLELRPDDLEGFRAVEAVILKPTLLGGIARAREWAVRAQALNIRPVVSGCFESGVGLLALAAFAWSCTEDGVPAGLDTYRWLAEDVIRPRIPMEPSAIEWSESRSRLHRIDMARLCERRIV